MDRQLPDKAIDLMDEATSALKMELESEPIQIDKLKREIAKLEGEIEQVLKDMFKPINVFLDEHNYKSYYARYWKDEEGDWTVDVGSHTEFFILKEVKNEISN